MAALSGMEYSLSAKDKASILAEINKIGKSEQQKAYNDNCHEHFTEYAPNRQWEMHTVCVCGYARTHVK